MKHYSVTFEIVTPESSMIGDWESYGFISTGASLRDALADLFDTRTNQVGGVLCVEPDDSQLNRARSITVYNGMEFETGAHESRTLHFPGTITGSSTRRLCRLIMGA